MKAFCIVNPCAGKGKASAAWERIKHETGKIFPDMELRYTACPGDAVSLAREAVNKKKDLLIIVGGDGTIHEAVNGIDGGKILLGIIPAGTGNDLAKTLGIPGDAFYALQTICTGVKKKVDLGKANGQYFINMGGLGFDAKVAYRVNRRRFLKGKAAYLWEIIRTIIDYQPVNVKISMDGITWEEKVTLIAVGNGQYVGGGVQLMPQACMDDGLFDICVVKETGKLDILSALPKIYTGKHTNHPKVEFYRAKEIIISKVDPEERIFAHIDGQEIDSWPCSFTLEPNSLEIIIPGRK